LFLLYCCIFPFFFFFTDTLPTAIYTLSLHDALPISLLVRAIPRLLDGLRVGSAAGLVLPPRRRDVERRPAALPAGPPGERRVLRSEDTRLNSSHLGISYAVFCLKKKKFRRNRYYL